MHHVVNPSGRGFRVATLVALAWFLACAQPFSEDVDSIPTTPEGKAALTAASAQDELNFMRASYGPYLRGAGYGEYYEWAIIDGNELAGSSTYFRAACSMALASLTDRRASGIEIDRDAQDFMVLAWNLNHVRADGHTELFHFRQVTKGDDSFWLTAAAGMDCLLAANIAEGKFDSSGNDPVAVRNVGFMYQNFAQLARDLHEEYPVSWFRAYQTTNKGNSMAEESGAVAAYLVAAAKLIPHGAPGSPLLSATERSALLTRAGELVSYATSQCDEDCPFDSGSSLVANHQWRPNPIYTLSILALLGEINMIYKQLGEPQPSWFPSNSRLSDIGKAIRASLDERFRNNVTVDVVNNNGDRIDSINLKEAAYTISNDDESLFRNEKGVVDWGFDARVQNSAWALLAERLPAEFGTVYDELRQQQVDDGLDSRAYFPPRFENGQWSNGDFIAAKPTNILGPLMDGIRSSSREQQINSHWFLNTLAHYNHTIAFLLRTDEKLLSGQKEPPGLTYQAESSFFHTIGRADGDGWSASVANDARGFMLYGPYTNSVSSGARGATFRMLTDFTQGSAAIATLDVYDATAGVVRASRVVRRDEFAATWSYVDFTLPFTAVGGNQHEFRVWFEDVSYVRVDKVTIH